MNIHTGIKKRIKTCSACGYKTSKDAITLLRDWEQWWHFSGYTTKAGNTYNGTYCPKCSENVYRENKQ